jgi:hypothetical protein
MDLAVLYSGQNGMSSSRSLTGVRARAGAVAAGRIINFVRESLSLQLIRDLPKLVEIDTRPESVGI